MPNTSRAFLKVAVYAMLALLVCSLFVWLLVARDTLCLARTGTSPNEMLFIDDEAFRGEISDVREEALRSLVNQFDRESRFFFYEMHPRGMIASGNNDIRQLIASRILAEESRNDPAIAGLHAQNLDAIMRSWYREENGIGYVYADEKSKLGANAMLLRLLAASPHFEDYRDEAHRVSLGIFSLMGEDGSFRPWFKEPPYVYDADYLLTFYSGEAILGLLEYAERSGDAEAYRRAVRAQNFYIGEYVDRLEANYYPAYVPWHTLSLAHLFEKTGNTAYRDAVFVLNDKLLELQDTETFIGRFYDEQQKEYGTAHVSADGVYTKGLAAAYRMAKGTDEKRAATYRTALVNAFHNLQSLQYEPSAFMAFDDREARRMLKGGFMTHACNRWVRIDNTAHSIDAFDTLTGALEDIDKH